jgi:hypothetical protein
MGVALYALSRVNSSYVFAIVGAVGGVVVTLGMDFYRRTARLTQVRITVPQLSELTFVVNNDSPAGALAAFRGVSHQDFHPAIGGSSKLMGCQNASASSCGCAA